MYNKNMESFILEHLRRITTEEREILNGKTGVRKELYTANQEFVIDSKKMLERGKLIDIRTHTRFATFPKHCHNYVEMIYMCEGKTTHRLNGETELILEQGELLLMNQNVYHEIMPAGEEDIAVNFMILPEFFEQIIAMLPEDNALQRFLLGTFQPRNTAYDYIYFKVADILPVQNLMENLVWSFVSGEEYPVQTDETVRQMTMGLLFRHLMNYTELIAPRGKNSYEKQLLGKVTEYIDAYYRTGTLKELAKICNQPYTTLSRFIKNQTGSSFLQLMQQKRLNRAVYLMNVTQMGIEEIIKEVGYENSSYFHKVFKKNYGVTPKKYRDSMKNRVNKDGFF